MSLSTTGFELVTKHTLKREFLYEMALLMPWSELLSLIALHAPAGKTGRPPFATDVMPQCIIFVMIGLRDNCRLKHRLIDVLSY